MSEISDGASGGNVEGVKPESERRIRPLVERSDLSRSHQDVNSPSMDQVWDRINELMRERQLSGTGATVEQTTVEPEEKKNRKRRRLLFRTLDGIALLLWGAMFVKLFVVDIDRTLTQLFAPGLLWILDFRFFFALILLTVVLVFIRMKKYGWSLLYIACFPLVVVLWKIPKIIAVNFKRPAISLGVLNILTSFIIGFKPVVIALAVGFAAGLMILLGANTPIIVIGISLMTALITVWLMVSIRSNLKSSRFLSAQQRWIDWLTDKNKIGMFRSPASELRPQNSLSWTPDNANQYISNAGSGLLIYRAAYYWAYSLDQYRLSSARTIFSGLAILALVVEVAITFAFINFGIFRIDPDQFQTLGKPEFWTFLYYSFSACWFGEIAALAPVGAIAVGFKIANGILGSLVILTVVVTLFQTHRQSRADEESREAVEQLRLRANEIGEQVGSSFAESAEDLELRLNAIGWVFAGAVNWLSRQVPGDWSTSPSQPNA